MKKIKQRLNVDILDILTAKQRRVFWFLLVFMTGFGLIEAFAYSLIIPYLDVLFFM